MRLRRSWISELAREQTVRLVCTSEEVLNELRLGLWPRPPRGSRPSLEVDREAGGQTSQLVLNLAARSVERWRPSSDVLDRLVELQPGGPHPCLLDTCLFGTDQHNRKLDREWIRKLRELLEERCCATTSLDTTSSSIVLSDCDSWASRRQNPGSTVVSRGMTRGPSGGRLPLATMRSSDTVSAEAGWRPLAAALQRWILSPPET